MDSLNFFFGLKAMRTPEVLEAPLPGTAIVYMSKHGTTQKVALLIKMRLEGENTAIIDLNEQKAIDLNQYERVIIGGSIHMGRIQKEIKAFCLQNMETLKWKELGLFLCCMHDGMEAVEQFNYAFPSELRAAAKSMAMVGYELHYDRMNFLDRAMTKKITGTTEFRSHINQEELNRFVNELKQ